MKSYTFTVTFINEILAVLGEQKAKDVYDIIVKIHREVASQEAKNKEETPKE